MKNKELLVEVAKDFGLEINVNELLNVEEAFIERLDYWRINGTVKRGDTDFNIQWQNDNPQFIEISFIDKIGFGIYNNEKIYTYIFNKENN